MAEYELAIRALRAVTPAGVRPVTVAVRDGRIAAVAGFSDSPDAAELAELPGREILLPGLVDTHVRSEEHTSELQSQSNLVCRLLLDKKQPAVATNRETA